jgi:hypothetical protein
MSTLTEDERVCTWVNGKQQVTGSWRYHWPSDRFVIELNSKDRITGTRRRMVVAGDTPEWGNWKLQRKA